MNIAIKQWNEHKLVVVNGALVVHLLLAALGYKHPAKRVSGVVKANDWGIDPTEHLSRVDRTAELEQALGEAGGLLERDGCVSLVTCDGLTHAVEQVKITGKRRAAAAELLVAWKEGFPASDSSEADAAVQGELVSGPPPTFSDTPAPNVALTPPAEVCELPVVSGEPAAEGDVSRVDEVDWSVLVDPEAPNPMYPVSFSLLWRALGYSRKDAAVRALAGDLKEERDFCSTFVWSKDGTGGHNEKRHWLTLRGAQHFCMIQRSEVGYKLREYFIDREEEALDRRRTDARRGVDGQALEGEGFEDLAIIQRMIEGMAESRRQAKELERQHRQLDRVQQVQASRLEELTERLGDLEDRATPFTQTPSDVARMCRLYSRRGNPHRQAVLAMARALKMDEMGMMGLVTEEAPETDAGHIEKWRFTPAGSTFLYDRVKHKYGITDPFEATLGGRTYAIHRTQQGEKVVVQ